MGEHPLWMCTHEFQAYERYMGRLQSIEVSNAFKSRFKRAAMLPQAWL